MRFRIHLQGDCLRQFNEAWEAFANITREEVGNRQHNISDVEFKNMETLLLSRLRAVRKIVSET